MDEYLLWLQNEKNYSAASQLALLYDSGARAQEICDIMIGDITFAKTSTVRIHGKGNKAREIPISSDVMKLIKSYLAESGKTLKDNRDEHLFPSQRSDRITTACIRNLVCKYVALAKSNHPNHFKEEDYSPHSFRHSKAIHMLEVGIPLIYIRNFLGHESVQTTEIYLRIHQGSVSKILKERKTETSIPNILEQPHSKIRIYPISFRMQDNNYVMSFWDKRLKYSILVGVSRSQKLST